MQEQKTEEDSKPDVHIFCDLLFSISNAKSDATVDPTVLNYGDNEKPASSQNSSADNICDAVDIASLEDVASLLAFLVESKRTSGYVTAFKNGATICMEGIT